MDIQNRIIVNEVKEVQEYQNIIQTFENILNQNNFKNHQDKTTLKEIITKFNQNKQNIASKFQSKDNEINEYKNILEKKKSEKLLINQLQQTNKNYIEKIDKYINEISILEKKAYQNDKESKMKDEELEGLIIEQKEKGNKIELLKIHKKLYENKLNTLQNIIQLKEKQLEELSNYLKMNQDENALLKKILEILKMNFLN